MRVGMIKVSRPVARVVIWPDGEAAIATRLSAPAITRVLSSLAAHDDIRPSMRVPAIEQNVREHPRRERRQWWPWWPVQR